MEDGNWENRRAHYRLRYPRSERPAIRIGDREFVVMELSEGGTRILLEDLEVKLRQAIAGTLIFKDGERVDVEGSVLRFDGQETIIQFSKGVSLKRMLAEQIHVKRKYPLYFDRAE
jgi:hypothetical protein